MGWAPGYYANKGMKGIGEDQRGISDGQEDSAYVCCFAVDLPHAVREGLGPLLVTRSLTTGCSFAVYLPDALPVSRARLVTRSLTPSISCLHSLVQLQALPGFMHFLGVTGRIGTFTQNTRMMQLGFGDFP